MNKINRTVSIIESVNKIFYIFGGICLLGLFLLMTYDVLGGFLFNSPFTGAMEYGTYLLAALAFLGMAYTQYRRRNVLVDTFSVHFPGKLRNILVIIGLLLSTAFFAMMTRQTFLVAYQDWQIKNIFPGAAVNLPVWIVNFTASVGCALIVITLILQVIQKLSGQQR